MKSIASAPNLVDQVTQAVLDEITSGRLRPGERVIQEQMAQALGVSRQPVQQALLLLRNQRVLHDASGRGLIVAPLDADHVRDMYEMRAVLEGLAARRAAEQQAERAARIAPALATHLTCTQRVMGEVLEGDEQPVEIWDQHERILMAISAGDAPLAESLARAHIGEACDQLVARLRQAA